MGRDPLHGRGARTNAGGRFERFVAEAFDDGWTPEEVRPLETIVTPELAKSIISTNQSPDISFDQSINPYRGCEHGCIYCYARPNHAYVGLSPGLDFETKLFVKANAAELLEAEFSKASYRPKTIMLGGVTDIYQPIERGYGVTRALLEVMERWRHPVALITKSQLVMRDIDILARLAERGLARAAVSITTLDRRIARVMEPRAATPQRRLEAVRVLTQAGVPTTVMMAVGFDGSVCRGNGIWFTSSCSGVLCQPYQYGEKDCSESVPDCQIGLSSGSESALQRIAMAVRLYTYRRFWPGRLPGKRSWLH